jgi:outer membrane receptor protein involved in Fe transport
MRFAQCLLSTVVAGICLGVIAGPAVAQVRALSIPPGSLKSALDAFARQSGRQVIYRIDDMRGARSPGARGVLTTDEALRALLSGSGFTARNDPSGAIAIVRSISGSSVERKREPANDPPDVEIVVTGSRIPQLLARTIAPTISLSSEELMLTGNTAIGETLDELPVLRNTLTQSNSTRIDTGAGLNMLDLRGLGINRTLVLENGRRHVPGASFTSAVDVNSIPTDLIERVDIVTGGSSAVYGSDAIAGVVNFILKRDFEGFQLRGHHGISEHGDAAQSMVSALGGINFARGRGNLTASLAFAHSDDWYASDRARYRRLAIFALVDADPPGLPSGSDGITDTALVRDRRSFNVSNGGTFIAFPPGPDGNLPTYLFQPDGNLVQQTGDRIGLPPFAGYSGGNGSNLREGKLFSLYPELKRYNFNLLGHFTVSDTFEPFIEAKYVHSKSLGSSFGSFFSVGDWSPRERYRTDNPFLSAEARSFIRSAMGLADDEQSSFAFRRNFAELGPVAQHNLRETYRVVGGVRGDLDSDWTYEISANRGKVISHTRFTGNVNVQRYLLAIDAVHDPDTGQIVCRSQIDPAAAIAFERAADPGFAAARLPQNVAECVPLNPFGEGNVSPAARDYILTDTGSQSRMTQTVLNAFVTGNSGRWFQLPGGPVAVAAGVEFRRETYRDVQEQLLESGLTHATPLPPFDPPAFAVRELFGEFRLPLLANRPVAKELTFNVAGRLADYRGSVGTVFAWNAGGEWSPVGQLRFRVNRSRAIRSPNPVELHQPIGQNFSTAVIHDPCSIERIGAGSATREANCGADGVPEGFGIVYATSFPYLAGGNPELHEERSDSLTVGAIIQPRFLPGFSLSADYYDIHVKDVITSPNVQSILDACYDAATIDNQFCALFARNQGPGEGPNGEQIGQIFRNSLTVVPLNYAALKVRGVDVAAAYRHKIAGIGLLDSKLIYTLALQNDSFLTPEDPGRKDQNLLELGNPRHALKWNISLKRGPAVLAYQLRYFSKMSIGQIEDVRSVQGRPAQNVDAYPSPYLGGAAYHNVALRFDVGPEFNVYLGVDNIADRLPPPTITGVADEGGIYDNVGRFFYAGAMARF